jgi:hypothetical protein
VHVRGLGLADAEEPAPSEGFQQPADWTPGGRFPADSNRGFPRPGADVQGDVCLADMHRGRQPIPRLSISFHVAAAAFSRDGKWIALLSTESGQPQVYVQRFPAKGTRRVAGDRYPVTRSGASAPRRRRDVREIFHLGSDGRVWAVRARLQGRPPSGDPEPQFTNNAAARAAIHSVPEFDVPAAGQRFLVPAIPSPDSAVIVAVRNRESAISVP